MKMSSRLLMIVFAFALGLLPGLENLASAQDYGRRLGVRRGGEVSFEPRGSGVLFDALDPAIKKWYVPQELYAEYQWKQWEYTNYARNNYQRYVNTVLEGSDFYDFFGNFVNHSFKSGITIAASLHGLASVPNASVFEFCMSDSPLRHEITRERFVIDDEGYVAVPEGPGLGVTINEEIIEKYRVA